MKKKLNIHVMMQKIPFMKLPEYKSFQSFRNSSLLFSLKKIFKLKKKVFPIFDF